MTNDDTLGKAQHGGDPLSHQRESTAQSLITGLDRLMKAKQSAFLPLILDPRGVRQKAGFASSTEELGAPLASPLDSSFPSTGTFGPPFVSGCPEQRVFSSGEPPSSDGENLVVFSKSMPYAGICELFAKTWTGDPDASEVSGPGGIIGNWRYRQATACLDVAVYTVPCAPQMNYLLDVRTSARCLAHTDIEPGSAQFAEGQIARATFWVFLLAITETGTHRAVGPFPLVLGQRDYIGSQSPVGILPFSQYVPLQLTIPVKPCEAVAIRIAVNLMAMLRNGADAQVTFNASSVSEVAGGFATIPGVQMRVSPDV